MQGAVVNENILILTDASKERWLYICSIPLVSEENFGSFAIIFHIAQLPQWPNFSCGYKDVWVWHENKIPLTWPPFVCIPHSYNNLRLSPPRFPCTQWPTRSNYICILMLIFHTYTINVMYTFYHWPFVTCSKWQLCFPTGAAKCALNFTTYPYVAFGECGGVHEDISNWGGDGFPSTMCCRNALTVLSDALAKHARNLSGHVFISQSQWQNCSGVFHPQQGMSTHSCGFDNLFLDTFHCSNLALQEVQAKQQYQDTLDKCSHFDQPFVQSCADCTSAIFSLRDDLINGGSDNDTDRAICGVAALVAVAVGKPDDPSLADKFLRCLPSSSVVVTGNKEPPLPLNEFLNL